MRNVHLLTWRRRCSGRASAGPISEDAPIRQGCLDEQATRLPASQWTEFNGDLIPVFQILEFPSALQEDTRTAHLHAPVLGAVAFRNVDLNVSVRISPFKLGDGASQGRRLRRIKHGEGMMSRQHVRSGKNACCENGKTA